MDGWTKIICIFFRFLELLDKTRKPLRIQRHQVLNHDDSPVELCSSVETKGIMGNDGRPYVLDLLRTFPPDLNFQFPEAEDAETPEECRRSGFPQCHRHSLANLRPELIEAFTQHRSARGSVNTAGAIECLLSALTIFSVAGMNFMPEWCRRDSPN